MRLRPSPVRPRHLPTRIRRQAMWAGLLLSAWSVACNANDVVAGAQMDGSVRLYDYRRMYASPAMPDASALAAALLINLRSGDAGGVSVAVSLAYANALGTRHSPVDRIDVTLMGRKNALGAVSQAYVQYRASGWTLRAGDQYLDTPWQGVSDSRVLPAAYRALSARFDAGQDVSFEFARTFRWKSRTSDRFFSDNLYYPTRYDGDPLYGGNASLPSDARAYGGTWLVGSTYRHGMFSGQTWLYDFTRFARMAYTDGTLTFPALHGMTPFLSGQLVEEWTTTDNTLVDTGTKILGVAGRRVRSEVSGIQAGFRIERTRFDVSWNRVARQGGDTVGGGALISPFTATYATDPLYTTSMLRGLVEQGPGWAWKARLTQALLGNRLQVVAAYTQYRTLYRGDSHDVYLDLVYRFTGPLHGLQLRNRWERSVGGANHLNPGNRPFSYNRVMISYAF
ncbi:hypothetical protein L2Y94_11230 [Luteibacter aegosomatis]|uniref:hypothetical protein n=1 Tax=Luteibacter aegosomatis TaxID=2911537 RepID=UPI001FF8426F|nr:hypothetical protein [Luteibacter aegosomatis]UPG83931.1 hypothetical protein L2Y94_11230 [Luteibacter aegosomatis]